MAAMSETTVEEVMGGYNRTLLLPASETKSVPSVPTSSPLGKLRPREERPAADVRKDGCPYNASAIGPEVWASAWAEKNT